MTKKYVYCDGLSGSLDAGTSLAATGATSTLTSVALAGTIHNPGLQTIASPNVARISMIVVDPITSAITAREDLEITAYTSGAGSCTVTRACNGTTQQLWPAGSFFVHTLEAEDLALFPVTSQFNVFNVIAYGADPTGTNDSSTAVTNAQTALKAAGGGTLLFPAGGTYKFNTGIITRTVAADTFYGINATGATLLPVGSGIAISTQMKDSTNYWPNPPRPMAPVVFTTMDCQNLTTGGVGVLHSIAVGAYYDGMIINAQAQPTGTSDNGCRGWQIKNTTDNGGTARWTERTVFGPNSGVSNCYIGIEFDAANGTNSFGYTDMERFIISISVVGQRAVVVRGSGSTPAQFYNSILNWIGNNGNNYSGGNSDDYVGTFTDTLASGSTVSSLGFTGGTNQNLYDGQIIIIKASGATNPQAVMVRGNQASGTTTLNVYQFKASATYTSGTVEIVPAGLVVGWPAYGSSATADDNSNLRTSALNWHMEGNGANSNVDTVPLFIFGAGTGSTAHSAIFDVFGSVDLSTYSTGLVQNYGQMTIIGAFNRHPNFGVLPNGQFTAATQNTLAKDSIQSTFLYLPTADFNAIAGAIQGDAKYRYQQSALGYFDWGGGAANSDVSFHRSGTGRLLVGDAATAGVSGGGGAIGIYGLSGATQGGYFAGFSAGTPSSGTFAVGDLVYDVTNNIWLRCTVAGTPGTWVSGTYNCLPLAGGTMTGAIQYEPASDSNAISGALVGDTKFRYQQSALGYFDWGSGSANSDVSLHRSSAGTLLVGDSAVAGVSGGGGALALYGLSGANSQIVRFVGMTTSGAPTTGTFVENDVVFDQTNGTIWICTASGTPGSWTQINAAPITSSVNRTASATVGANESTIFSGTTAAQTLSLPFNPANGTRNVVANYSVSTSVSVAPVSSDAINVFGTTGPITVVPGATYEFVHYAGTWFCISTNALSHATGTLSVANGGTGASTSTGAGAVVLATSPALTTPTLAGTPTADDNSLSVADTAYVDAASLNDITTKYMTSTLGTVGVGAGASIPRALISNNTSLTLTSGAPLMVAIPVKKGVPITYLGWATGATAGSGVSNHWLALLDNTRTQRAVTADLGATISAKSTYGGSISYTPTYTGVMYIAICVVATTMPTVSGCPLASSNISAAFGGGPALAQLLATGETTPEANGHTFSLNGTPNVALIPYVWASA